MFDIRSHMANSLQASENNLFPFEPRNEGNALFAHEFLQKDKVNMTLTQTQGECKLFQTNGKRFLSDSGGFYTLPI